MMEPNKGEISSQFLALIRLGIGHELVQGSSTSEAAEPNAKGKVQGLEEPGSIDWGALEELAARQGLSAVLVDGVEKLPDDKRPPKMVLLQWIGETLQGYEYRFEQYKKAISELAAFYNSHGFKMMILKGYACSLDWPKPEHRPCGDIDIWQFGEQKAADAVLAASSKFQDSGSAIDSDQHIHTVFNWCEFTVENHYDFVNIYDYRSSRELESVFKVLGMDDSHYVEVNGEKVYLPSPNLHSLFLLRHMVTHFAAANITLRQVLDWAFFVEKHNKEVDWEWLISMLEKYHMKDFFNCINAICVEDLGFEEESFPPILADSKLHERVLQDILLPEFETEVPRRLLKRLVYKVRRRNGNAWKRKLCFDDSSFSSLLGNIWSHILRPSSI